MNGRKYQRFDAKWADESGMTVPKALSAELNRKYIATVVLEDMDYAEALREGDLFKENGEYGYAVRFYERAADAAESFWQASSVLPRVTSCYRAIGRPEKAIELFSKTKQNFGEEMMNEALLTSAAAAYCDMEQPENAIRCCKYAIARLLERGKRPGVELNNAYARAKRMAGLD